jgi:pimeloyl-ACP methyl ester carboxylesterase
LAILTYSDDRSLGYELFGSPVGRPVFFFHGTPGSRYFQPPETITRFLATRLICVDRPGYGSSAYQPGRSIMDWSTDIVQLADFLGITKFSIAAHSGGGPYALACAAGMPDRVESVALISSMGLPGKDVSIKGAKKINQLGFRLARYLPWPLLKAIIAVLFQERISDPGNAMDKDQGSRPQADDLLLARSEVREACLNSEQEAFRSGLKGFAWDVHLITKPWEIAFESIRVPIHLWHGAADNMVPVAMARNLADKIPGSRLTILNNEGHLLLFSYWHDIISELGNK